MLMKALRFRKDDSGAVTVDWVVLTAAIVGLSMAVILAVRTSTSGLAVRISTSIGTILPG